MLLGINLLSRQLGRFVIVGSMGVVVDFSVYIILTRTSPFWQHYFLWANVVAFVLANLHNFFWHRRWTFGVTGNGIVRDYGKFLSASLGYLVVIESGLAWLTHYAGWPDLAAKLVSTLIAVAAYFIVLRTYIFKSVATQNS